MLYSFCHIDVCVIGLTLPWHAGALQPPAPTYCGTCAAVEAACAFVILAGPAASTVTQTNIHLHAEANAPLVLRIFANVIECAAYTCVL
ncbi:MAG: hypothetical protein WA170_17195 [Candidatus Acidiferrales bacterium]